MAYSNEKLNFKFQPINNNSYSTLFEKTDFTLSKPIKFDEKILRETLEKHSKYSAS